MFILVLIVWCEGPGLAETRSFRLSAPDVLVETGFLKHLLPRFSLKHGVRVEIVAEGAQSDVLLTTEPQGTPVFRREAEIWYLRQAGPENEHVTGFEDWLTDDVGRNTIEAFKPDGRQLFTAALKRADAADAVLLSGNVVEGEELAVLHCGRCHMVNEATRMTNIGSTPSFAVMRAFSDWQIRFEAFFALNPHPSFTVIEGVTEPFDITRPSPMVPVTMSLEDLEAILAFVSRIEPADLGAPIQYQ
ncbi:hypothetical protein JF539_16205 [Labrenzia aggregata]|uniref:Cytochrome c domain-containing protein n=1 Tax=Roseibium aggregatum TaxID=187304 RepID=A0A939J5M8_9HYPH|nr:hypothetical protein [Roseibium aggregatum]